MQLSFGMSEWTVVGSFNNDRVFSSVSTETFILFLSIDIYLECAQFVFGELKKSHMLNEKKSWYNCVANAAINLMSSQVDKKIEIEWKFRKQIFFFRWNKIEKCEEKAINKLCNFHNAAPNMYYQHKCTFALGTVCSVHTLTH